MVRAIIGTPRRHTSAASSTHAIPATGNPDNDDLDGNASDDSSDHDASSDPPTPSDPPQTSDDSIDPPHPTQTHQQAADDAELWSDYIRRCTRRAEELMSMHDIPDVTQMHRKMVWQWAARVATHPPSRWTQRTLKWNPNRDTKQQGYRQHGGQHKRWDDDLRKILHNVHRQTGDDDTQRDANDDATQPRRYLHRDANDVRWLTAATRTAWWNSLERAFVAA